ncbi:MAG: VWA domain-containing protein [Gordonia sp. (in: high G+C Gram-positive bacteria)]|uniref:vWA domain-containing protein n=1 Tax=Gordonia sp. (in: high G+C Gram-positive bacteria) TaxID=84139 RepID=UPI003BB7A289
MIRRRRRTIQSIFSVLAVVCLALTGCSPAIDGAAQKGTPGTVQTQAVPTIVVLDASDSMNTDDAPGPRIQAARTAVVSLADSLPAGTDFGVVAFGSTKPAQGTALEEGCTDIETAIPLGPLDKGQLSAALDGLHAQGFTPIGTALETAAGQLPESGAGSIVLISDGASTCAPDPCETAKAIHQQRPDITVSAVGFRTDEPSLACIAANGGGLFVTADNTEQLIARLAAAQNAHAAASRLSPTSRQGVSIGQSFSEIRGLHPDFPSVGRTDGARVIIVWIDCSYTFENDVLVEIAPGDPPGTAGTTIDGVASGTPGARAVELYGQPVQDSGGVAVFPADEAAGTAYRISYTGGANIGSATSKVTAVVLCRCLPGTGGGKNAGSGAGPAVVEIVAVDKAGNPINGFSRGQLVDFPFEAKYCRPGVGAITAGVYFCGAGASAAPNCWPSGSKLLCALSPEVKELREVSYTGSLPDIEPKADPWPWTLTLDDGTLCVQKFAGAWDMPPPGFGDAYSCASGSDYKFVYVRSGGGDPELFDKSGKDWTVFVGSNKVTPKPTIVKSVTYSAAR